MEYPRPGPIWAPFISDEDLSPVRVRDDSLKDVMLTISMILNKNLLNIKSININVSFKHKFKDYYKRARISLRKKRLTRLQKHTNANLIFGSIIIHKEV